MNGKKKEREIHKYINLRCETKSNKTRSHCSGRSVVNLDTRYINPYLATSFVRLIILDFGFFLIIRLPSYLDIDRNERLVHVQTCNFKCLPLGIIILHLVSYLYNLHPVHLIYTAE